MLYTFPGPFVWWGKVERHQEIKKVLLPQIDQLIKEIPEDLVVPHWNCTVHSSFGKGISFLRDPVLKKEIVWDPLDACLSEVTLTQRALTSRISEIWFNQYEANFFQEVHDHGGASFSGIYLLELNEANSTAFFHQGQVSYLQGDFRTEEITEGNVIIFPSCLPHYVNPTLKKRTTISFNVFTEFE